MNARLRLENICEITTPETGTSTTSQKSINPFFASVDPSKLMSGKGSDKSNKDTMLTPTTFQHNLCLNATSDVNVNLTDDEDSSDKSPNENFSSNRPSTINCTPSILKENSQKGCVCSTNSQTRVVSRSGAPENPTANSTLDNYFPAKLTPITDEYKITHEIIGIGESGKVMACFSHSTNQKYALKVLRDGPRSRREVYLHYLTNSHPHIVSIIDIFENSFDNVKCLLVVVEFLEGGDLLTRFENQNQESYPEKQVAKIIRDIGSVVEYLHEMNIAHRDIKLENILCSCEEISSENCVFKLADFGFAKRSERNNLMESPCCTPAYVCPEILSHERYDKSCDMWALGVVMYILLCGYPPFYSMKGLAFSPGMKDRITVGLYAFPHDDWDHIFTSTKDTIRKLLKTDPAARMNIQQLMASIFLNPTKLLPVVYSDSSLSSWDGAASTPCYESPDSAISLTECDDGCGCARDEKATTTADNKPVQFSLSSDTLRFCRKSSFQESSQCPKNNNLHAISARDLIQPSTNEFTKQKKSRNMRLYSIQEEVGLALDMMRLGGNSCFIKSLKIASSNRLLSRRRAATSAAIQSVAQQQQ